MSCVLVIVIVRLCSCHVQHPEELSGEELFFSLQRLAVLDPKSVTASDVDTLIAVSVQCHGLDMPDGRNLVARCAVTMSMHPRACALLDERVVRELLWIMRKDPRDSELIAYCVTALYNMIAGHKLLAEALVAQGGLAPVCAAMDRFSTLPSIITPACGILYSLAHGCGFGQAVLDAGGVPRLLAACKLHPSDAFIVERGTLALRKLGADPAAAKTVEFEKVRAAAEGGETPPSPADIERLAGLSRRSR